MRFLLPWASPSSRRTPAVAIRAAGRARVPPMEPRHRTAMRKIYLLNMSSFSFDLGDDVDTKIFDSYWYINLPLAGKRNEYGNEQ